MSDKRKPDYVISVLSKVWEKEKGHVGAAWKNEDGSISIVLNPAVVLDNKYIINLFPTDGSNFKHKTKKKHPTEDAPF